MSKTGDRLRTLAGYWQPMGLDHTLMDIAKMADKEVDEAACKPVIAADGEPLEVGQTVYNNSGSMFTVCRFDLARQHGDTVGCDSDGLTYWYHPDALTHQRPVLDAEGSSIETGMDVWWVCEGDERGIHAEKLHVESIGEDGFVTCDPFNGGTCVELEPSELYVHKPVLDADGVSIHEGDTVWTVRLGTERKVLGINRGVPDATHIVRCEDDSYYAPSQLTHNKPETDSWERIEEDAALSVDKYRERRGISKGAGMTWPQTVREDIVRRCRALAERGK